MTDGFSSSTSNPTENLAFNNEWASDTTLRNYCWISKLNSKWYFQQTPILFIIFSIQYSDINFYLGLVALNANIICNRFGSGSCLDGFGSPPLQWQHIASIRYGSLSHVQLVQWWWKFMMVMMQMMVDYFDNWLCWTVWWCRILMAIWYISDMSCWSIMLVVIIPDICR